MTVSVKVDKKEIIKVQLKKVCNKRAKFVWSVLTFFKKEKRIKKS